MQTLFSDNGFQYQLKSFKKIQITIYISLNLMYNIIIIKVLKQKLEKLKNNLKIQITIYKQMKLMYNINIIKVKEIGG